MVDDIERQDITLINRDRTRTYVELDQTRLSVGEVFTHEGRDYRVTGTLGGFGAARRQVWAEEDG